MAMAYAQICQQEKVEDLIDFPLTGLDLSAYLQQQSTDEGDEYNKETPLPPAIYDLYAVSNHYGGLNGGHYTAYGYNTLMGKWYDFDDSCVSALHSQKEVVTDAAYLLFYRRREVPST